MIKRFSKTDAKVDMGLTEAEITEHSIRKIMECIIQDFPRNNNTDFTEFSSMLNKTEKGKEDDNKKPID